MLVDKSSIETLIRHSIIRSLVLEVSGSQAQAQYHKKRANQLREIQDFEDEDFNDYTERMAIRSLAL